VVDFPQSFNSVGFYYGRYETYLLVFIYLVSVIHLVLDTNGHLSHSTLSPDLNFDLGDQNMEPAVQYVQKIKNRCDSETYKHFLEILSRRNRFYLDEVSSGQLAVSAFILTCFPFEERNLGSNFRAFQGCAGSSVRFSCVHARERRVCFYRVASYRAHIISGWNDQAETRHTSWPSISLGDFFYSTTEEETKTR
jgi:hypothetical protein